MNLLDSTDNVTFQDDQGLTIIRVAGGWFMKSSMEGSYRYMTTRLSETEKNFSPELSPLSAEVLADFIGAKLLGEVAEYDNESVGD